MVSCHLSNEISLIFHPLSTNKSLIRLSSRPGSTRSTTPDKSFVWARGVWSASPLVHHKLLTLILFNLCSFRITLHSSSFHVLSHISHALFPSGQRFAGSSTLRISPLLKASSVTKLAAPFELNLIRSCFWPLLISVYLILRPFHDYGYKCRKASSNLSKHFKTKTLNAKCQGNFDLNAIIPVALADKWRINQIADEGVSQRWAS